MKTFTFAILSALLITVQANSSWYVPSRNITCHGASSGRISCQEGHIDNAAEVCNYKTIPQPPRIF